MCGVDPVAKGNLEFVAGCCEGVPKIKPSIPVFPSEIKKAQNNMMSMKPARPLPDGFLLINQSTNSVSDENAFRSKITPVFLYGESSEVMEAWQVGLHLATSRLA